MSAPRDRWWISVLVSVTISGGSGNRGRVFRDGIAAEIAPIPVCDKLIGANALARSVLQRSRVGVLGAPPPRR
jgi:hypothetical protein